MAHPDLEHELTSTVQLHEQAATWGDRALVIFALVGALALLEWLALLLVSRFLLAF